MEAWWWQPNYNKSQCLEVYGWQYILILEGEKEPSTKWNVGDEQTGLMAHTHILNAARHCNRNKKIDEAVQKSSGNRQCRLNPLTVRLITLHVLKCGKTVVLSWDGSSCTSAHLQRGRWIYRHIHYDGERENNANNVKYKWKEQAPQSDICMVPVSLLAEVGFN